MLIRSDIREIAGEAVATAGSGAFPAAFLPTLLIGGLLLICP
jgi:hypothetical protein